MVQFIMNASADEKTVQKVAKDEVELPKRKRRRSPRKKTTQGRHVVPREDVWSEAKKKAGKDRYLFVENEESVLVLNKPAKEVAWIQIEGGK